MLTFQSVREKLDVPGFDLEIDTDPERIDVPLIHSFLSRDTYWAMEIPEALFRKSIQNALCFGVYDLRRSRQIAFCRVVTDLATFGWLSDVYVDREFRGKGISKALVTKVMAHPDLQGFRRFLLGTKDAHSLYEKFGFKPLVRPEIYMEIWQQGIYRKKTSTSEPDSSG